MTAYSLHLLAGARTNHANAYLLHRPGFSLLLDAGASTRAHTRWLDQLEQPPSLLFLSHVHADHIGALPQLWERHGPVRCIATPQTCALLPVALEGILRAQGHKRSTRAARAASLAHLVKPHPCHLPLSIRVDGGGVVDLTLLPSGHVPGAASLVVDMRWDEKFHRFCYLPDFSTHDQPLTPGAALPCSPPAVDTLLVEGALGDRQELLPGHYATQLQALSAQLAAERPRLLGVSALGEGPELVHWLQDQGTQAVTLHQTLEPVIEALQMTLGAHVTFGDQSRCRGALATGGLVLAPGAQFAPGTPVRLLAQEVVGVKGALIACFNSVHKGSWIARALGTKQGGMIKPERVVRRAHIQRFLLPNHAPPAAHLAHLEALAPRHVILTHGRISALATLGEALGRRMPETRVSVPREGEVLEIEWQGEVP